MHAPLSIGRERFGFLRRRSLVVAFLLVGLGAEGPLRAEGIDNEAALRNAIQQYLQAWNRHDVTAWAAFLTTDVDYRYYARGDTGRDAAIAAYSFEVLNHHLEWDVVRVRMMPGGATVVMRTEAGLLPVKDGKYQGVLTSYPAISRWRVEDGRWRMHFFTSFERRAAAIVKDEALE